MEDEELGTDQKTTDSTALASDNKHRRMGLFSWIVALLVPVALVLTAMRLMMTTAFLRIEYITPNFPPDPYGFIDRGAIVLLKISAGLFAELGGYLLFRGLGF